MGRVTKLIHGSDGKVRNVILKLPNNRTAQFSLDKLHPLEIGTTGSYQPDSDSNTFKSTSDTTSQQQKAQKASEISTETGRPKWKAAIKARSLIRQNVDGN